MTGSVHSLAGAYAIDALDELERTRFERHLAGCEECTLEVASLRGAATELAELSRLEAPSALRADVLSAITKVRPIPQSRT